ncbi:SPOR domain-containing protein [Desulfovibrio mangrovi]|uniref:SPOR domain-containing protein n=1 Tax=Desulfovibrio mangrovi TaxID=2976983 RepID=UPI002246D636|nr:SPOR domain-containing protein [Desulfovibrio mangrovi]UZP66218.1 SPOR domain-containing protein [Desulfovibrio mangrovi]
MINIAGTFHVQIGAFSCPKEAQKLASKLVQQGFDASNPAPIQRNGHPLWTVRVGSYPNIRQARTVRTSLMDQHPDVKIKAVLK